MTALRLLPKVQYWLKDLFSVRQRKIGLEKRYGRLWKMTGCRRSFVFLLMVRMQNGPSVETVLNYRNGLRDDQKTQTAMLFSTHEALKLEEIEEIGNTLKVSWTSRAAKATMELKWFSEKHLLPVSMTWIYPTIAMLKREKIDYRLYWYLDCPKDLSGKVMGVRWEEQFDRIKMKSREQEGASDP